MQGAGRAQAGPDETVGKVWALTDGMTPLLPLLESKLGGLQGCVMSARLRFPLALSDCPGQSHRLCLTSDLLLAATGLAAAARGSSSQG